MNLVGLVTLLTLATIPGFILLDVAHRARPFDAPPFWRLRAFLVTLFIFALSFAIPMLWGALIGERSLLNLSSLGTWGGAAVGIVVYQLAHYWYHRAVHKSDFLFRWLHQMHHSAESLDAWGALYLSPLDSFFFTSMATLVFLPLLGTSVEAAVLGNFFLTFAAMFQHANLRTPQWLGYVIQRPESHGIHHERGVHRYNYCDLPVIDMLFGTFRNPKTFDAECGFYTGASTRIGEMLIGRDVTMPKEPALTASTVARVTYGGLN